MATQLDAGPRRSLLQVLLETGQLTPEVDRRRTADRRKLTGGGRRADDVPRWKAVLQYRDPRNTDGECPTDGDGQAGPSGSRSDGTD